MPFPYDLLVKIAVLLVLLVAVSLVFSYFRSSAYRGKRGERKVARIL